MKLSSIDPVRRLVGIVQMQRRTVVMLGDAGQSQFSDQVFHQRLGVRPEPGGAEVHHTSGSRLRNRQDAPAQPFPRLEQGDRPALPEKISRQRDAA
jgi:hypothetical protein